MPIITGNKPIFRIRYRDANIREVRKATELEWGLYEITYINKGPKDVEVGYEEDTNVPTYVWGYPNQTSADQYIYIPEDQSLDKNEFNLHVPENSTAAEAKEALGDGYGYRSHSDGWYDDNECLNYIPAITRDFHKDLTLFCKWRQRKYCFNGTYKYEEEQSSSVTVPAEAKVDNTTGEVLEIWIYGRTKKVWP